MTHRDGFPRLSARSAWRADAGHRKPCATPSAPWPKALGNRRSGRAGEPAAGESVRASESLADPSSAAAALPLRRVDVPQDPQLPSYPPVGPPVGPTGRLPDLYGSLSTLLGITTGSGICPRRCCKKRAARFLCADSVEKKNTAPTFTLCISADATVAIFPSGPTTDTVARVVRLGSARAAE